MRTPPRLRGADILFLEDDAIINLSTSAALEDMGCRVRAVQQLDAAWESARGRLPDAAILDVDINGKSTSLELAEWLDARGVPIIFLTGYTSPTAQGRWRRHPRARKPFNPEELEQLLNVALQHRPR
jgi:DNA-binding response OmpR family regulator